MADFFRNDYPHTSPSVFKQFIFSARTRVTEFPSHHKVQLPQIKKQLKTFQLPNLLRCLSNPILSINMSVELTLVKTYEEP